MGKSKPKLSKLTPGPGIANTAVGSPFPSTIALVESVVERWICTGLESSL